MNFNYLKRPKPFEPGNLTLWDNDDIGHNILAIHLNPDLNSGTRLLGTVDKSVAWIEQIAPCNKYRSLLDIGCGPGIYAERFYRAGYNVTGIDISPYQIEYANNRCNKLNYTINYICKDIFEEKLIQKYDLITMIYSVYSFYPRKQRISLLEKMYAQLSAGGKLILDVFTSEHYRERNDSSDWKYFEYGGLWSKEPYLELNSFTHYYDEMLVLIRAAALKNEQEKVWNSWIQCFTVNTLLEELKSSGFVDIAVYGDITGKTYTEDSETICVVAKK